MWIAEDIGGTKTQLAIDLTDRVPVHVILDLEVAILGVACCGLGL